MNLKHVFDFKLSDWLACLAFSLSAIFVNSYFGVPIYGSISVYIGSIFPLLALLVLPLRLSLLVLLSSLAAFYHQLGSVEFVLIQAAEFAAVCWFTRRKNNFLLILFSFWLVIGLPSTFFLLHVLGGMSFETGFFTAITISLNGFVCGILAQLIYWFIPISSRFKRFNPPPPKFSNVVFELCIVSVILPSILVTLVFTWRSTSETEKNVGNQLLSANTQLENAITGRMSHNLETVKSAAQTMLSQAELNLYQKGLLLNAIANANTDIESMIMTDKQANAVIVAPEKYAAEFDPNAGLNVSSRDYFHQTRDNNKAQVSEVLEGRGLGNADIIALTAPLNKEGQFNGIMQASILLEQLIERTVLSSVESTGIQIVITDQTQAIIYASESLSLMKKQSFEVVGSFHPFLRFLPAMSVNNASFIYKLRTNEFGWNIYTMAAPQNVFSSIVDYFLFIGLTILFSLILIGLLASRLAFKITAPLVNLEKFIANKLGAEKLWLESQISREMANLTLGFVQAHQLSLNFQEQLKEQVANKTKALKELNKQLKETAEKDALTGLYNRGAFDQLALNTFKTCIRNKLVFTMVLVDIDYFKKVNDTYGHAIGDKCIQRVADALSQRCKRGTDIVARYGGEEYILMLTGSNYENHLQFIREIHEQIAQTPVTINGVNINLTVSIGLVSVTNDFSNSFDRLVSMTDEQLYISKNSGRNMISSIDI